MPRKPVWLKASTAGPGPEDFVVWAHFTSGTFNVADHGRQLGLDDDEQGCADQL
jgi:hypothetical protein